MGKRFICIFPWEYNMLISEFEIQSGSDNTDYAAIDEFEMRDIAFSCLVVESLLTSNFYDKIVVRYGHLPDFKLYPESVLLMMELVTCNASVSYDIDGATESFYALTLDNYPGENIAEFSTEALRLIKIMQGGYALPINTKS
jgi:hypothetical protein